MKASSHALHVLREEAANETGRALLDEQRGMDPTVHKLNAADCEEVLQLVASTRLPDPSNPYTYAERLLRKATLAHRSVASSRITTPEGAGENAALADECEAAADLLASVRLGLK